MTIKEVIDCLNILIEHGAATPNSEVFANSSEGFSTWSVMSILYDENGVYISTESTSSLSLP